MTVVAVEAETKWKRYPAYRQSGVEWLGEVPTHWEIRRLKFACTINPTKQEVARLPDSTEVSFLPMEYIGEDGSLNLAETRPLEQVLQGYTYFRDGDVIVAKITPCFENRKGALCTGLTNGVGFGTTELHVLRANTNTDPQFLFYLTRTHHFREQGEASMYGAAGQKRVLDDFIRNFETGFPPLLEQRAIATFLDRETAGIDTLTAKKERLIQLLQEKRTALISHVVTKGLEAGVEMKESGVPTVGRIPTHWEVKRNKRIFVEVDGRSESGEEELLSVSHITGVTPRSEKEVNMFMAESLEGYKICRPDDLVINTMWAWMGALGVSAHEGIVSPSYNVYRLRQQERYIPLYLDLLYRTPEYVCEIGRFSKGVWSSRLRLYPDEFFNIWTVTPPLEEQKQIVRYLAWELESMDVFKQKLQQSIEKLREYRTALISAAVTGKIDVRKVAS